jgi:hypothetical protein
VRLARSLPRLVEPLLVIVTPLSFHFVIAVAFCVFRARVAAVACRTSYRPTGVLLSVNIAVV